VLQGGLVREIGAKGVCAAPKPCLGAGSMVIDAVAKPVLLQAASSQARHPLRVPAGGGTLRFSPAVNPSAWTSGRVGAVGFEVAVEANGGSRRLYGRVLAPASTPSDRGWSDEGVDLSPYAGQAVTLVLTVAGPNDANVEWTGWGDLRLTSPPGETARAQFTKVYDAEVQVYENRRAFPRAFLVDRATSVAASREAIAAMSQPGFDPASMAVVEQAPAERLTGLSAQGGRATIERYASNEVVVAVETPGPALLVLTDSYYPGWEAAIDGAAAPIYAADLAFRGVLVPAGAHRVTFAYRPASFALGLIIAGVGLVALGLVSFLPGRAERRKSDDRAAPPAG
jgi:hypothetical protein